MKNMVATALFIAITTCLFSQADKSQFLYTSDGKLIGEKQMLIKECADELDEEGMTKEGKEEICDCVLQQMASHLTYKDLNKMLKDDDFNFNKVFEDKKHKDLANGVIQCVFSFMHNGNELTSFRNEFLSECVKNSGVSTLSALPSAMLSCRQPAW